MKAYLQKNLEQSDEQMDRRRVQKLFRMAPPYCGYEYIVASASNVPFTGPEVYLFAADSTGEITEWGELPGSQRRTLDIEGVLRDLDYEIVT